MLAIRNTRQRAYSRASAVNVAWRARVSPAAIKRQIIPKYPCEGSVCRCPQQEILTWHLDQFSACVLMPLVEQNGIQIKAPVGGWSSPKRPIKLVKNKGTGK